MTDLRVCAGHRTPNVADRGGAAIRAGADLAQYFRASGSASNEATREREPPRRARTKRTMRAVVHDRYGPPDVLRIEDVDQPVPKEDQILVRVHATTVTRSDCGWRSAKPFISRFFTGVARPKRRILGTEFSGEVETVGAGVNEFAAGDRVFGASIYGAYAEFVAVRESSAVAHIPAGMTFEEAAAVCDGAILALNAMRPVNVGPGLKMLLYGASGAIGTAGVQLAKQFGADVP